MLEAAGIPGWASAKRSVPSCRTAGVSFRSSTIVQRVSASPHRSLGEPSDRLVIVAARRLITVPPLLDRVASPPARHALTLRRVFHTCSGQHRLINVKTFGTLDFIKIPFPVKHSFGSLPLTYGQTLPPGGVFAPINILPHVWTFLLGIPASNSWRKIQIFCSFEFIKLIPDRQNKTRSIHTEGGGSKCFQNRPKRTF